MGLVALTDRREIAGAIDQLKVTLNRGARKRELEITTPGGGTRGNRVLVMWNEALELWAYVDVEGGGKQYWCCYGIRAPDEARKQGPIVHINSPIEGKNLHCQGAFGRDEAGELYYLHTGGIGGGHKGVGKETFVGSGVYGGQAVTVQWPDSSVRTMYVIGRLGDENLVRTLADYVHSIGKYRSLRQPDRPELRKFSSVGEIFISHSSKDHTWCEEFIYRLKQGGASAIWYDQNSLGAGGLNEQIKAAITSCPIFIVVLSPDAVASDYVNQEVDFAIKLYTQDPQRKILPVMAVKCNVPPRLARFVRLRGFGDTGLAPEEAARNVLDLLTRQIDLHASGEQMDGLQGDAPQRNGFWRLFGVKRR